MIAELRTERERLDEAILALERLSANKGKRRGRPPKWLVGVAQSGASDGDGAEPGEATLSRVTSKRS
jgi:hypothetical protein